MQTVLERLREIRAASPASEIFPSVQAEPREPGLSVSATQNTHNTQNRPLTASKNWNQAASDVLGVLVRAARPVPHPQIVRQLAECGYSKEAAFEAIAHCQGRKWIEHNLTTGYTLAEDAEQTPSADCTNNLEASETKTGVSQ